jgi:hypothetical protein
MTTSFNALEIRRRLGRGDWSTPTEFGPDGWKFVHLSGEGSVIITCSDQDDGNEWVHASVAWVDRMPTYADLKWLHAAVFDDGWAYQLFVPPSDHVNIHEYALHLWGRLDGKRALPDFTRGSGLV